MIHSQPPIHPTHHTREKADSGRLPSSPSRFRELVRKKPKAANDEEHKDRSPPSLFALIQHESKETDLSDEQVVNHAGLEAVSLMAPGVPNPRSALLAEHALSGLSPAPWQNAIVENATQGITHILAEEMKETSLTLNGPLFANTPLAGVKVIVREYSTAPLAFNVHFACAPLALDYLQPHLKTLASLFSSRRYPFSIHSIDADLGDGIPPPIQREKDEDQQHEEAGG